MQCIHSMPLLPLMELDMTMGDVAKSIISLISNPDSLNMFLYLYSILDGIKFIISSLYLLEFANFEAHTVDFLFNLYIYFFLCRT